MRRRDPMELMFALIVRAYPRRFRDACGEEMQQLFRDQRRALVRAGRPWAAWPLLARTLVDAARSIPREHHAVAWQSGAALPWMLVVTLMLAVLALFAHRPLVDMVSLGIERVAGLPEEAARKRQLGRLVQLAVRDTGSKTAAEARMGLAFASKYRLVESSELAELRTRVASLGDRVALDQDIATLRETAWSCVAARACDPRPALARLQHMDADNAAVWLLTAQVAAADADAPATLEALSRAAEAPDHATPHATVAARWMQMLEQQPYRSPFWARPHEDAARWVYQTGISLYQYEWGACQGAGLHEHMDIVEMCDAAASRGALAADTLLGRYAAARIVFQIRGTHEADQAFRQISARYTDFINALESEPALSTTSLVQILLDSGEAGLLAETARTQDGTRPSQLH